MFVCRPPRNSVLSRSIMVSVYDFMKFRNRMRDFVDCLQLPMRTANSRKWRLAIRVSWRLRLIFIGTAADSASMWKKSMAIGRRSPIRIARRPTC